MKLNVLNYLLELKYGKILKEHQDQIDNADKVFSKYAEIFMDEPYPLPESTTKEIESLISIQKENMGSDAWQDIKEFIQGCDEDPISVMEQYCKAIDIDFKRTYIEKLQEKIGGLILILKKHYNRPRPYQFAYYTNQDFNPLYSSSAISPAYPSGHTIQAYFICEVIAFHNPEKREDIMQLAKMIADSREILGVHYESDNLFSRYIVDELIKQKEIKDIYFNEKKLKKEKQEN